MGLDACITVTNLDGSLYSASVAELGTANRRLKVIGVWPDTRFANDERYPTIYDAFQVDQYDGNQTVFKTLWRYWSPGYERGPWANIYGVIQVAKAVWPNHIVNYSSDSEEPYPMTKEREEEYWAHIKSSECELYYFRK